MALAEPTFADSIQKVSISSSFLFLVSGTHRHVTMPCAKHMTARKPKVNTLPITWNAKGKNRTTKALATHCRKTGTVMARPRTSLGKISGTRVQKTGPMQQEKKARDRK